MGGKARIRPSDGLRASVVFEPKRSVCTGASICVADGLVVISGANHRGTQVHQVSTLSKRALSRHPKRFATLFVDGDEWIAGGAGGIFHSSDSGGTWIYEPIADVADDRVRTIARWDDALWVATDNGTVLFKDSGAKDWRALERDGVPPFEGAVYGYGLSHPQVGISHLLVIGDDLYALGQGLWRIVERDAELELESAELLIAATRTRNGTLLVGVVGGALHRRPQGGAFGSIDRRSAARDFTCVAIVELASAILFVGGGNASSLHVSSDDGRSLSRLSRIDDPDDHLKGHRFLGAVADGQGGAIVAGFSGTVVRVAPDPHAWSPVTPMKAAKRAVARPSAPAKPRAPGDDTPFIDDIRHAPDDDAPRLVYADRLLEHQDPRGEFIQIQCMLGRAIYGSEGTVRASNPPLANLMSLEKREAELYGKHRRKWMAPFAKVIRKFWWRRGFIDGFTSGKTFFDHAPAIFAAHPLSELRLQGLGAVDVSRLAKTPLPGLRTLNISRQRLTPALLEEITGSVAVSNLDHLDLWGNEFGDEGAQVLAADLPPRLQSLRLQQCNVTIAGVTAILEADAPGLQSVSLSYRDLDDEEKVAIRKHPRGSLVSW